jgi:hypothetical protein
MAKVFATAHMSQKTKATFAFGAALGLLWVCFLLP